MAVNNITITINHAVPCTCISPMLEPNTPMAAMPILRAATVISHHHTLGSSVQTSKKSSEMNQK
jgi:hypothetical protein